MSVGPMTPTNGLSSIEQQPSDGPLLSDAALTGWCPIIAHPGPPAALEWCHADGRLGEPFFDQTVQRWLSHPFNHAFRRRTDLGAVIEAADVEPGVPVVGLVFHQSRCGSTLIGSMLAAAGLRVLSEPGVLDAVARAPGLTDGDRARALAALASVLGRPCDSDERGLVIKLDSWATRSLDHYRRAFPDVPWMFVYREPVEVMVSQLGHRAAHTVPGALPAELFGQSAHDLWGDTAENGVARVIASITEPILDHLDDVVLVPYDDLPRQLPALAGRAFGLDINDQTAVAMLDVARFDAKNPVAPFVDDRHAKEVAATPAVRAATARWLQPLHERLEAAHSRKRTTS